jgi:molecular chaperone HtpG
LTLSVRQPQQLTRFVNLHHLALKIQAAHDPELARIITRWLPLETSVGRITVTELLGWTRNVRYAQTRNAFLQLVSVAGRSVPFVNAGQLYDVKLLEQLPELYDRVTVEHVDVTDVLTDLDDPPLAERSTQLRLSRVADESLASVGCQTVVKSFEPASLPALYMDDPRTLCLNYRSPIIQHLARLNDQTVLSRTVQLLYAQARLHGHIPLRGIDSDVLSKALLDLVQLASLEENLIGLDHG